jgi:glycosyltransferase involved in cell wall biosynthesis
VSDVDVVIPCFNTERYIAAALESALGQVPAPSRIIVIDDGSTDRSADVILGHASSVEYHRQPNGGICAARNAGVALARAQYLAFLDADDLWTPDALAVRLRHLNARPHIDGVFGALTQFVSPELADSLAGRLRITQETSVARFAGTFLVRRASFERVGPFDESLRVGEMIEWLARAEGAGLRIDTIDALVLRRRVHDANTVSRQGSSPAEYLRAVKGALDRKRGAGEGTAR